MLVLSYLETLQKHSGDVIPDSLPAFFKFEWLYNFSNGRLRDTDHLGKTAVSAL